MIEGYQNKIRNIDPTVSIITIEAIVFKISTLYCGMKVDDTSEALIRESAKFIQSNYKDLGIDEILLAFELAAQSKFSGVNIKAYGGIFSISIIGDVIEAYKTYRGKIIYKVLDEQEKIEKSQKFEEEKDQRNSIAMDSFMKDVEENIISVQNDETPKWDEWEKVPAIFAEKALRLKLIDIDGKRQIWERARLATRHNAIKDSRDNKSSNNYSATQIVKSNFEGMYFQNAAERVYAMMVVFQYIQMHKI